LERFGHSFGNYASKKCPRQAKLAKLADLQLPATATANARVRDEFRLNRNDATGRASRVSPN
jgi:hypothetical protein